MLKITVGFVIAFLVGAGCRYFNLPVPAPPSLVGVGLIFAISIGFIFTDYVLPKNQTDPTKIEQVK